VQEIGTSLGADSLAYISLDAMVEATTIAKPDLCRACFDGEYPMAMPDADLLGKHFLESSGADGGAAAHSDVDGVDTLLTGPGGADALRRP
jgi:amidophosphoribosyltransferase